MFLAILKAAVVKFLRKYAGIFLTCLYFIFVYNVIRLVAEVDWLVFSFLKSRTREAIFLYIKSL